MLDIKLTPKTKEWYRASHMMLCKCGKQYIDHPREDFLFVLCNGDRVKL